jgi:very-short-patch-repair endonuclease
MIFRCLLLSLFVCRPSFAAPTCRELFKFDIQKMIDYSREGSREKTFRKSYQEFFAQILIRSNFTVLSRRETLEYLTLLAQWRLLPPSDWSTALFTHAQLQIKDWSDKNFLAFALQRKLTPLQPPRSFLESYRHALKERFHQLSPTTQLETFSAELYHGALWETADMLLFLRAVTKSLNSDSQKLPLKAIKEMYRSILFLTDAQRAPLLSDIAALTEQLEIKMQAYNLSLNDGGTSGSQRNSTTSDPRFVSLVMDLQMLFSGAQFQQEFSSLRQPGFFDPVDLFIAKQQLVVEWDGPHHYFRPLALDGSVREEQMDLVLRPADQARDRLLRGLGYKILRISPPLAKQLDFLDLPSLIQEQNPQ